MIMNTNRTKLYAAVCVLFGSAAVGTPWTSAQAQASEPPPPAKTVKFADLDIQTVEGAKVLYHRIRLAAHQVCLEISRDPVMREGAQGCIDKAIDHAVKKVDAPYLTALRFGNGNNGNVRLASK
jgi:UrcA family protein